MHMYIQEQLVHSSMLTDTEFWNGPKTLKTLAESGYFECDMVEGEKNKVLKWPASLEAVVGMHIKQTTSRLMTCYYA